MKFQKHLKKKGSNELAKRGKHVVASREQVARFLKHLGDPFGQKLMQTGRKITTRQRNMSVLIHGFEARSASGQDELKKWMTDLERLLNDEDSKAKQRLKTARLIDFSAR